MSAPWLSRALVALAVPALVVPALATPASAAKAPEVPSVAQVTKIYPRLGGEPRVDTIGVRRLDKNCEQGKRIKGARATAASYAPTDPDDHESSAAKPDVSVVAMRFPSVRSATAFLSGAKNEVKCPVDGYRIEVAKIRFKLGAERRGWTLTLSAGRTTVVAHTLLVRKGKHLVMTGVSSFDGQAPSVKKAVRLTKVALKAAS